MTQDYDLEEAISAFEQVLEDYEVISKSEAEAMVAKAKEKGKFTSKTDEAAVAGVAEFEDDSRLSPQDLQAVLPADVWKVVRQYLATDGAPLPDADEMEGNVEKAVGDALTTSGETLRKVRGELAAVQDVRPSHEPEEVKKASPTDAILERFYQEPATKPIKKGKKDTPACLAAIQEAGL